MKTKLIKILFAVMLAMTCTSTPVSANYIPPESTNGTGYNTGTVKYNGKNYNWTLSISIGSSYGVKSMISTAAYVQRKHYNLDVKYNTTSHGYITKTGGAASYSAVIGATNSGIVYCGYSDVIGVKSAYATGKVIGETTSTISAVI